MKRGPIKRKPRKPKRGDCPEYLEWVRTLVCLGCFNSWYRDLLRGEREISELVRLLTFGKINSQAAHIGFSTSHRGIAMRYPDREAGPLCFKHHDRSSRISIHNIAPEKFFEGIALDRDAVLGLLNRVFDERQRMSEGRRLVAIVE